MPATCNKARHILKITFHKKRKIHLPFSSLRLLLGGYRAKSLRIARCALFVMALVPFASRAQRSRDFAVPQPMPRNAALVVGFLGGLDAWDDPHRGVRKVALDLRGCHSEAIFSDTVENRHARRALELIRKALDTNGNGQLDDEERKRARLVLFGQSLGGAAAIHTAEVLNKWRVPVLLTVQIDSFGLKDGLIPANVNKAANFYQRGLLTVRGRTSLRAQDPNRTEILGSFLKTYPFWSYDSQDRANASLARLRLGGGHARMEADSELWNQVEELILTVVRPSTVSGTAGSPEANAGSCHTGSS